VKLLFAILVIIAIVVLCALFGPDKPQPAATPGQTTTTAVPAPLPGPLPGPGALPPNVRAVPPTAQAQRPPTARERGDLSVPVAATGVTTETVNQGPSGATFEAKRRITEKLRNITSGSSGGKNTR
jgi:hypothetical protein